MANEVAEIAVNVKEKGTDQALGNIADASAEGDGPGPSSGSGGSGGGSGGGIADMLGGISTKLMAILGFVAFLASLKPIQELLSGIQRLFSVAILPLVSLLMMFLRPVLQDLLRFIADLDFDNLVKDLTNKLGNILGDTTENAVRQLPGVDSAQRAAEITDTIGTFFMGDEDTRSAFYGMGGTLPAEGRDKQPFFADLFDDDSQQVNVTGFREQSNTTMDQNAAETTNRNTINSGPGGQ